MAQKICCMQHKKWKEAEKNGGKDEKELYKLINNDAYGKTMKNVRNRLDIKLVSNTCKSCNYLKWTSKPSYMSHKIFNNDLAAILKNSYINELH